VSGDVCELYRFQESTARTLLDFLPRDVTLNRALMIGSSCRVLAPELASHFSLPELFVADRNAKRLIELADSLAAGELAGSAQVRYCLIDTGGPLKRTQRQLEKARLPRGGFSLLVSHNEIPWHEDLAIHFYFARMLLARGGFYALLGPGPNHLPELFSILGLPPYSVGRHGAYEVDHIAHLAEASGLEVIRRMRTGASIEASSVDAVLGHAVTMGLLRRAPKPSVLRELTRSYVAGFGQGGPTVRATCEQWLLLLRSPGPLLPRSQPATP
jgi:hypothetical protein